MRCDAMWGRRTGYTGDMLLLQHLYGSSDVSSNINTSNRDYMHVLWVMQTSPMRCSSGAIRSRHHSGRMECALKPEQRLRDVPCKEASNEHEGEDHYGGHHLRLLEGLHAGAQQQPDALRGHHGQHHHQPVRQKVPHLHHAPGSTARYR